MAVRIRLARAGAKKRPVYRVVVADRRAPRDGRFVELLGQYDPRQEELALKIDDDRLSYWLGTGAQPSEAVKSLLLARKRAGKGADAAAP